MTKPFRYLIFLLVPACALGALWLLFPKLLEFSTALVESEQFQIKSITIGSLGLKETQVKHLEAQLHNSSGLFRFNVRDATLSYDITTRELDQVIAAQAEIDIDLANKKARDSINKIDSQILIPPNIRVDHASIIVHSEWGRHSFNGAVQSTLSDNGITVAAQESTIEFTISSDPGFSQLHVTASETDDTEFAKIKMALSDFKPENLEGTVAVKPFLSWMRQSDLVPAEFRHPIPDNYHIDGTLDFTSQVTQPNTWRIAAELDQVETNTVLAKARIQGELTTDGDDLTFVTTRSGVIHTQIKTEDKHDPVTSFSFKIPEGYRLASSVLKAQAQSNDSLGLVLQREDIELNARIEKWSAQNDWEDVQAELSQIELSPYSIAAGRGSGAFHINQLEPLSLQGTARITHAHSVDWENNVADVSVSGKWQWERDDLKMRGLMQWGSIPEVPWSMFHRNESGEFNLSLEMPVTELSSKIQEYANMEELTFIGGNVKGEANVTWANNTIQSKLDAIGTELHARIQGMQIQNGILKIESRDLAAPTFDLESTISKINLASEIEISDFSLSGQLQNNLHISQANLRMFNGQLSLKPTDIDFEANTHKLELDIEGMELNEILAALEQPGLEGSGKLSGTLPLRITKDAIEVENGRLLNLTSGVLRYRIDDGDTPVQLDNIALQALRDFRFDVLDSTLSYGENGDYLIKARLEGKNPELYDGYPIAFNLNLSGTLPGLARASLFTGDFQSELLKRLEEGPRKNSVE